jgi:ssDNA-binding Zn-finger/Zn-ribbon topoisomerase 1
MTLNEAIKHCYEVADRKCDDCGKEHLQLAKWLEELQDFKNKADFVEVVRCGKCKWYIDGRMQCGHPFVLFSDRLMTTQFCSYGERRDT